MRSACRLPHSIATVVLLPALAAPALAHHPMGGAMPSTWLEGVLSGIGHPVIAPDHLSIIVAMGVIAAYLPAGLRVPLAFVAASLAGVVGRILAPGMPLSEEAVAATVLLAGIALALGRVRGSVPWLAFALVAGTLHGYAFGEAIVGAERTPLLWYLVGLAVTQTALAVATMMTVGMLLTNEPASSRRVRTAGGVMAALGAALLATTMLQA